MGNIVNKYRIIELPEFGDDRGNLVVIEGGMDIPFDIKRAFYIYPALPSFYTKGWYNSSSHITTKP